MAWDARLAGCLYTAGMKDAHAAAFADFLDELLLIVRSQPTLHGEILGWLHYLGSNEAQRRNAFRIAAEAGAARWH